MLIFQGLHLGFIDSFRLFNLKTENEDGTTLPSLVEDTHEPLGIVTGVLEGSGSRVQVHPGNLIEFAP